jgi:DNA-binding response OmpR family regulator
MNLLVVGETFRAARALGSALETGGYTCALAFSAFEATERAKTLKFDAIILDQGLADRSGVEVVKELRRIGVTTPAIVLGDQSEIDQRLLALSSGVADLVLRPISEEQLLRRLDALFRRNGQRAAAPASQEITLDKRIRGVRGQGRAIRLSPREFSILEYLFEHRGKAVSRAELSQHVWRTAEASFMQLVPVYVNRLRRKIDRGNQPSVIETVRGQGYRIRPSDSSMRD